MASDDQQQDKTPLTEQPSAPPETGTSSVARSYCASDKDPRRKESQGGRERSTAFGKAAADFSVVAAASAVPVGIRRCARLLLIICIPTCFLLFAKCE